MTDAPPEIDAPPNPLPPRPPRPPPVTRSAPGPAPPKIENLDVELCDPLDFDAVSTSDSLDIDFRDEDEEEDAEDSEAAEDTEVRDDFEELEREVEADDFEDE